MILYHGSTQVIEKTDISFSRLRLDFGQGFYTTPLKHQALSWASRFKKNSQSAVLNIYEFDEHLFKQYLTQEFYSYNEDWLDFVFNCRTGQDKSHFDIIIGGVADDRVFNTIELFLDNLINKQEALGRLVYEENNLQICFRNQELIQQHLIFKGSEIL